MNSEHARLSPNTEIIVAPNERKQQTEETVVNPDFFYEPSPLLVVQVCLLITVLYQYPTRLLAIPRFD